MRNPMRFKSWEIDWDTLEAQNKRRWEEKRRREREQWEIERWRRTRCERGYNSNHFDDDSLL